jgi:hypothetical protein
MRQWRSQEEEEEPSFVIVQKRKEGSIKGSCKMQKLQSFSTCVRRPSCSSRRTIWCLGNYSYEITPSPAIHRARILLARSKEIHLPVLSSFTILQLTWYAFMVRNTCPRQLPQYSSHRQIYSMSSPYNFKLGVTIYMHFGLLSSVDQDFRCSFSKI